MTIEIWTAEDLYNVRNDLTGDYIQMANINLSAYQPWSPIGSFSTPFNGTYDGNGFDITGLYIDYTGVEVTGVGLFSTIETISIMKNISIKNAIIKLKNLPERDCYYGVGALAGVVISGQFENCYVDIVIESYVDSSSAYFIGGLIGYIKTNGDFRRQSILRSCTVDVNLQNLASDPTHIMKIGGLVGYVLSYESIPHLIIIEDCHVAGYISGSDDIGGLVGVLNYAIVERCSAIIDINAEWGYIGGFAGTVDFSVIKNCFYKGTITCNNSFYYVGGFVNGWSSHISDCYSVCIFDNQTGDIIEDSGSFIGDADTLTITSCYYNSETSLLPELFATPKTTAEMKTQSTYIDWDFDNVWHISSFNDGYPAFEKAQGFDIYVITFNESTQQKELKQVEEIKLITGTNELKVLENISEFKVITDTGLK